METDVLIIGGGIVGTAVARELARYNLDTALVEKEADVACGTSKANSGIIHAGYNAPPDSVKGYLNVRSNPRFDKLCSDLKVPFKRIGSLVVGFDRDDLKVLKKERENGEKMGVKGLQILGSRDLFTREPRLNKKASYALYAPTAGIISPYLLTIAYADNAAVNGVKILLNTEVRDILTAEGTVRGVSTNRGSIECKLIINAAGLFADRISAMASAETLKISPRKGEYHLFDKEYGELVNHVLFPIPTETSKGILVTPTVHGNLLIGPNSYVIDNKEDVSTTKDGLQEVVRGARKLIPGLPEKGVVTSFSGLRAAEESEDFVIGYDNKIKGLINAAGIQSPGLSSAPAIAEKVVSLVADYINRESLTINMNPREDFSEELPAYPCFTECEGQEWQQLVRENGDYGEIVCRCESITRGEIIDAIHRPVPAKTVDAVKRRTRAGMGRCQGGFCGPRVVEILARELGVSPLDITKKGQDSTILKAEAKELINTEEKVGELN